MNNITISKTKSLRGDIIKNLYDIYDMPIPMNKVNGLLRYKNYYSNENIKKAITYLAGSKKEYLTIDTNEKDYWASFVQLTPKGVNLAEGDISDLGVILSE